MGYTLAATLDLLPPGGSVVVSELVPEVVEWNRGPLGPLAGHPLDDPRTDLIVGEVADVIRDSKSRFDAVLLDVDNGVDSLTRAHNSCLYTAEGLAAAHRSLRPRGALALGAYDLPLPAHRHGAVRNAGVSLDGRHGGARAVRGDDQRGGTALTRA